MTYKIDYTRSVTEGILYEAGDFWVCAETFGRKATPGFAVYQNKLTHAVRVASIGYSGERGIARAIAEAERRNAQG